MTRFFADDRGRLFPFPTDGRAGYETSYRKKKLNKTRLLFVLKTLGRKTLLALHNHVKANRTE